MLKKYLELYEYDRSKPLDAEVVKLEDRDKYTVYKVYYNGWKQRVPAILTIPKIGSKPFPCIVFLHGHGGRKEDVLALAEHTKNYGYVFFSIDAVYHGERRVEGKEIYSPDLEELKLNTRETVIDMRRGVDFLETRPEIDKNRIGYAGGSMGGIIGALFISVEPRIKAAVITVPGGKLSLMLEKSEHHTVPAIRKRIKELGLSWDEIQKKLDPIDPINFIHLFSPRPLQIHIGKYDRIVPAETGRLLAEKAGEPKEVYWYDAGHGLPLDIVLSRAMTFFKKYL